MRGASAVPAPVGIPRWEAVVGRRGFVVLAMAVLLLRAGHARGGADETVQFNRDLRPILSDTCFLCHGPDKNSREAGLRLDVREEALQPADSGEIPIVPGKPDESEIIRRIFAEDEDELMPPPESHKTLTPAQKELFRRWVAQGAVYQPHWLYVPLVRPPVPEVTDKAWVQNPIDALVLAELERRGIRPSPPAAPRRLLRRLSLDLVGLPPLPDDVAAWLADTSPAAYERQVERLLASPHYGERLAAWWLDVARMADTVGFHGDQNQRIFPYRDYVIDAFNENLPFDQFTREQLAGDLLPDPTPRQLVATGFNRLNMMTREGGAQPKEYLAKYGAERVRTIGTTWLGSTLGCVECHDHKYDPYTMHDFYALQAFFADVKQWGVYSDYGYTPNPELRGWSNDHPFPPEIEVESPFLHREIGRIEQQMTGLFAGSADKLAANPAQQQAFDQWLTETRAFLAQHSDGWQVPEPKLQVLRGGRPSPTTAEFTAEGVIRYPARPAGGDELRIELRPAAARVAAFRLELVPDPAGEGAVVPELPQQRLHVSVAVLGADGKPRPIGFYHADANVKVPRYASTVEQLGILGGWVTPAAHSRETQTSVWLLNPPLQLADNESLVITLKGDALPVPVRAAVSPLVPDLPPARVETAATEGRTDGPPPPAEAGAYLLSTAWDHEGFSRYRELYGRRAQCRGGRAWTMVTVAAPPMTVRVLPRGNWQDESGPVVEPAVPHFLPPLSVPEGQRPTRLDLANWLCSAENPVTARTIMNRLWKQFFGHALSNVVDDLGAQGEPPSHPELLDWLAVEFRESGWNLKHMIRLIVTSQTYRQDSRQRPELRDRDPNNRLLAFQSPRRLDAEFVRDNALAVAGLLNPEIGGPSVKPYQPPGYYANLQFPDRDYVADADERQWRRGVYMHWQRTFLHPMLANFDASARDECTANRVVSNTPQQALTLLNDPTFVEAARAFAQQLLAAEAGSDEARLDAAFQRALARPPAPPEVQALREFLAGQREHFRANPGDAEKLIRIGLAPAAPRDAAELAAWIAVCRVILNLHETITRY